MSILSTRFLRGLKRRITIPANQNLVDDDDILEITDDVIRTDIVPLLVSTNENFYVYEVEQVLTASEPSYDLPKRSSSGSLRDLKFRTSDSSVIKDLRLINLEDAHIFNNTSNEPHSFYFEGDRIKIAPTPSISGDYLKFYIQISPARLVLEEKVATVLSIASNIVTVNTVPTNIVASSIINFLRRKGSGRFISFDKTVTSVTTNTITFASGDVPASLEADDIIALTDAQGDQSSILQIPEEIVPYLETLVGERILTVIGDTENAKLLREKAKEEKNNVLLMIQPRVRGEAKVLMNRRGLLRGKQFHFRRSLYN